MLFRSFVDNRWFAEHEPYILHHLTLVQAGISSTLFLMATKIDLLRSSLSFWSSRFIFHTFSFRFQYPAIASGTYKLTSVRASMRASVRASVRYSEISESVHRNFLKFGTKLGLPNATEVTFSDFARKIPFGPFWPFLGPKMAFLAQKWTFRPFSRKLVIGSSQFCIFKLHFGSIYEINK